MSTVIITDSACELPDTLKNSKSVKCLPINIVLGDDQIVDNYTASDALSMIHRGDLSSKVYADSSPANKDQIKEFLIKEILPNYDYAIVQTVSSSRSSQYDYWLEVSGALSSTYKDYRAEGRRNFSLSVVDSGAAYSGQGLLAMETIRLARRAKSKRELIGKIKEFTGEIQSYSAPADLGYLRKRAKQRGDNTIGFIDAVVGRVLKISPVLYGMNNEIGLSAQEKGHDRAINVMLEHGIEAIKKGLKSPYINISYGGDLSDLDKFERFAELKDIAEQYDCKVYTSVSRLSSLINLGPNNFSMALACNDPGFVIKAS